MTSTMRTNNSMAMEFYCQRTKMNRQVALPPGLTAEEANDWAQRWMGKFEVMVGVVEYR